MIIKTASGMPRPRLKRLSPWILVALAFLLALSLSIDAVRRDSTAVAVAPPPAPNPARAAASSLKTIAVPLTAAEQPAVKVRDGAGLKEIPPAGGRLQRTRFGQEGPLVKMVPQENVFGEPLVKMVPQEKIVAEPLAALGPDVRRPRPGNPDPNSVFSWGPWSQTTSLARVDGLVENDAGQQGYVRTAIVTQARQDTAVNRPAAEGLLPPGVIPPVGGLPVGSVGSGDKGNRPGWGHGDKNHSHHHKHHHQHHGRRDR
jgi:hypothetical protein